jgi:hypothetical protein
MFSRPLWITILGYGLVFLAYLFLGIGFIGGLVAGIVLCHLLYRLEYGRWWSWDS